MQFMQQRWARIVVQPPLYAVRPQARPVDVTPVSRRSARDYVNVEYTVNVTGARRKHSSVVMMCTGKLRHLPYLRVHCVVNIQCGRTLKGSSACLAAYSTGVYSKSSCQPTNHYGTTMVASFGTKRRRVG